MHKLLHFNAVFIILFDLEMKRGHVPARASNRLGYWTSEEFYKFTLVSDEVLRGLVSDEELRIWFLVARMTELVFHTGRSGWTENDVQLFSKLAKRYHVLVEETLGISACVVTGHNLQHICEDVRRFSCPDNYWCFVFERSVKRYVERSSNKKHIECTFARAEERRELSKHLPSSTFGHCSLKPVRNSKYDGEVRNRSFFCHIFQI